MSVHSLLKPALLASALGALLVSPAAIAQDSGRYADPAANATSEDVIVTAPNLRGERTTLGLPGKMSFSREVSYHDLNLSTRDGARELRQRVRDTARDVCDQLRDAYPVKQQPLATQCYEGALKDAMIHADEAIRDARDSEYYQARYRGQ